MKALDLLVELTAAYLVARWFVAPVVMCWLSPKVVDTHYYYDGTIMVTLSDNRRYIFKPGDGWRHMHTGRLAEGDTLKLLEQVP